MNFKVTVIINYHNSEKFIIEAIDSVIKQTFKDWCILLFDNNSNDNTFSLIESYIDNKKVKYFRSNELLKLGKARNSALQFVQTPFVAILDSDDVMEHSRLEKQYNFLNQNSDIFLVSSWVKKIDVNNKIISFYQPKLSSMEIYQNMGWENPIVHSSVMFRTFINGKKVEYNNHIYYAQDYDFYLTYITENNFKIINDYLSQNRIHNSNLTKSKELKEIISLEQINHLEKAKILKLNKESLSKNKLSLNLCYLKLCLFHLKNLNFIKFYKFLKNINSNIIFIFLHIGPIRRYFEKK